MLVMTTDDIAAIRARLVALGAEVLAPPLDGSGGLRSMSVRDPDSTRMEITRPPLSPAPR